MENLKRIRKFEKICEIVEKHSKNPDNLIPILQEAQEEYRYLSEEIMTVIATSLNLSPARVFGVATFFSHFSLKPKGKYIIKICDGTACHVKGSTAILEALRKRLRLDKENSTTADMLFTIETVSCLGACGLAPVFMVNENVYGNMTPAQSVEVIDKIFIQEGEKKCQC